MFETLFFHIQQKVTLTEQEQEQIPAFFTAKKLRRRQYLLQEGDVCKYMSFVTKGLLKSYNVDEKGEEHVSLFGCEGWWMSDLNSFISGEAAVFNIDAIEDTEVLQISRADYEALTLAVPVMDRYFRILFQNSLVTKDRRLLSSITHTAEEKYLQFAAAHADLIQRIPQHLIASYLGLAPETISRIKRQIAGRNG